MISLPENPQPNRLPPRLRLLVAAHVAADLALVCLRPSQIVYFYFACFGAIVFAQVNLVAMLSMWAKSPKHRDWGTIGGFLLLVVTSCLAGGADVCSNIFLVLVAYAVVLLGYGAVEVYGCTIKIQSSCSEPASAKPLQFGLRRLFWITAISGVLVAVGKGFGTQIGLQGLAVAITLGTFFLTPPAALWAVLGQGHVVARCGIVLAVTTTVGVFMTATDPIQVQPRWFWSTLLSLQAVVTIGSLLVVRSYGYRLVSEPTGLPTSEAATSSASPASLASTTSHDLAI
jgi:hypothetical protein